MGWSRGLEADSPLAVAVAGEKGERGGMGGQQRLLGLGIGLRRGSDRANIYSIAFSPDSKWLAVSSDKGTMYKLFG
ncbi:hypothetical protein E2562_020462 [Oryza meyeriana var. granulata]|uniref:Uncharacterized protein n=1 Tax=Oryza meyeriana var. granulata TaxID=110450 RepID=A0A6G1D5P8_9ORYZ|nr:hypothetical protein E2562_020462 [Oryza meyeriana var. granulata]